MCVVGEGGEGLTGTKHLPILYFELDRPTFDGTDTCISITYDRCPHILTYYGMYHGGFHQGISFRGGTQQIIIML